MRNIKFKCCADTECVIPIDADEVTLRQSGLPLNCTECEHYQHNGITYKEFTMCEKIHNNKENNT